MQSMTNGEESEGECQYSVMMYIILAAKLRGLSADSKIGFDVQNNK